MEGEQQLAATNDQPRKEGTPIFRPAKPEEDDLLSRVLCNAFLPIWNHNWFHNVSEPLQPVSQGDVNSKPPPMTSLQQSRVRFYRSLIRMTRLIGGLVLVADVPSSTDPANDELEVGAILLWLPPSRRLGDFDLITLWRSGFMGLMLPWHYGLTGFHRIQSIFEANIHSMFTKALPNLPRGFKPENCGFIQMLASNPKHKGKRYASALLKFQIEQHFAQYPDTPVILDTTTTEGVRAYERLGFKLLGEMPVDTKTDASGIRLKSNASDELKREAKDTCIQRVMTKLP